MSTFDQHPIRVQIYFLRALAGKGNVFALTKSGYSYVQIFGILESAKQAELAALVEGKLSITDKGAMTLKQLLHAQPEGTVREWLIELPGDRIPPLKPDDVYVPPLGDIA